MNNLIKVIFTIFCLAGTSLLAQEDVYMNESPVENEENYENDFYVMVEKMPVFIDPNNKCINILDESEKIDCSKEEMFAFINQIAYPKEAVKQKLEGKTYVRFVIYEDGSVQDVSIMKSSGHVILDEAAKAHVSLMKFAPGMHREKLVKVVYLVPVHFKL